MKRTWKLYGGKQKLFFLLITWLSRLDMIDGEKIYCRIDQIVNEANND